MAEQFANAAQSILSSSCLASDTNIYIASALGFPSSGNFSALLQNADGTSPELIEVTAISGTQLTCVRAAEPYGGVQTAYARASGALITVVLTVRSLATVGGGTYTADETTLHLTGTVFSIISTYAGQTSITTLGTVATGTWNATIIGTPYGGTGVDNSTGGVANTFWARPNGATGAASYRLIVAADVPTLNQNTTGSSASCTGNAATATALQTARAINGVNFDGTAAITVAAAAGTLTGTTLNATVVTSSLTTVGTIGTGVWAGTTIVVAHGGTGLATLTAHAVLLGEGTGNVGFRHHRHGGASAHRPGRRRRSVVQRHQRLGRDDHALQGRRVDDQRYCQRFALELDDQHQRQLDFAGRLPATHVGDD